jgi:hypothetical protein
MSFDSWMSAVNDICLADFSMSIHDLPDMCFWDAHADGQTPEEFMAENLPDLESLGELILS